MDLTPIQQGREVKGPAWLHRRIAGVSYSALLRALLVLAIIVVIVAGRVDELR